ncbi:MAG: hypothetical protein II073_09405 [Lachnospiraceae bacterium]|nr:hypothetical protein [Lachnospiraceae bacterium]
MEEVGAAGSLLASDNGWLAIVPIRICIMGGKYKWDGFLMKKRKENSTMERGRLLGKNM